MLSQYWLITLLEYILLCVTNTVAALLHFAENLCNKGILKGAQWHIEKFRNLETKILEETEIISLVCMHYVSNFYQFETLHSPMEKQTKTRSTT